MIAAEPTAAAQPTRNLPLRWRLWFVAGLLLTLYGFYAALHWAHKLEAIPAGLSTIAHICVTILVLAGCIDVALSRMDAQDRKAAKREERQDRMLAERDERIAAKLAAVDEVVRRLTAAPTVNLHELRQMVRQQGDELQEKVLMGHAMVARRFADILKNEIEASARASKADGVEEITKSVEALGEKVDRLEVVRAGGNVVPMPNPQIYQLGIAEGERRAREGRDKPH